MPTLPQLIETLRPLAPSIVAFSGGVDSAFLLAAAIRAASFGKEPAAVFTISATQTAESIQNARAVAEELHVPQYIELPSHEMEDPDFVAGTNKRCYYCKRQRLGQIREWAQNHPPKEGEWTFLEGNNADDLSDYRPGSAAAKQFGFRSPLADGGWTKNAIRAAAAVLGLSCADRPSEPCLITRLAYGLEPNEKILRLVERAETILRGSGFPVCRLRIITPARARIEVGPDQLPRFQDQELRDTILGQITALGFDEVTIDPAGYHRS
ncbi:MAG: ATP-dependent sacrificial sulfur transferase LarE [Thermoguttaceae bacterium]|nr:ATP-dependent sacrificial sulfur transferase LarE [Thermoguttaceae bacterium]